MLQNKKGSKTLIRLCCYYYITKIYLTSPLLYKMGQEGFVSLRHKLHHYMPPNHNY